MSFIDIKLVKQLNDIAQGVSRRKCKNALGKMLTIETALIKKHCQNGLTKKLNHNTQKQIF